VGIKPVLDDFCWKLIKSEDVEKLSIHQSGMSTREEGLLEIRHWCHCMLKIRPSSVEFSMWRESLSEPFIPL